MSLLLLLLLPVAGLALVLWLCRCGQGHKRQERRGGGDNKGTLRVRQSVTSELTIPGDVVGRVIGRHGLRVRQLEEESGARIKFKDQQQSRDKVWWVDTFLSIWVTSPIRMSYWRASNIA